MSNYVFDSRSIIELVKGNANAGPSIWLSAFVAKHLESKRLDVDSPDILLFTAFNKINTYTYAYKMSQDAQQRMLPKISQLFFLASASEPHYYEYIELESSHCKKLGQEQANSAVPLEMLHLRFLAKNKNARLLLAKENESFFVDMPNAYQIV